MSLVIAVSALSSGCASTRDLSKRTPSDPDKVFNRASSLIEEHYIDRSGNAKKLDTSRRPDVMTLLAQLDGSAEYYDPEASEMLMAAKKGATGASIKLNEGSIEIQGTMAGSPARKAGLHKGDNILEIDDIPVTGRKMSDVTRMMQGPVGSQVKLKAVDPEIQKLALKGYERGESPITVRPADVLKPELEAAKEATKGIARDIGDVLTYALYPQVGLRFLKWKYGLETPPADVRAKTLDDVKREDELITKAKAGKLAEKTAEKPAAQAPSPVSVPASGLRHFNVHLDGKVYCVGVESASTAAPAVTVRHEPVEGQIVGLDNSL